MTENGPRDPLDRQIDYYRARAAEYDEWWLRRGRYDRGAELNARWFEEAAQVSAALEAFRPEGRVLELACGTGIWTEQLVPFASQVTALDASPEMLAINAARVRSPKVSRVEVDIFRWRPAEPYDVVFFAFWLSHVPPDRFAVFWDTVRACLAPGGRVFFVDSRRDPTSTAVDHRLPGEDATVLRRRLNDGREFVIYKIFHDPAVLAERLGGLGWRVEVHRTDRYFLYGHGKPASE
jgi:demethylmenaquinone methyltransferase/2-methoxy-6-polyprenyl-1,4-benzoquinol methylase